MTYAFGIPLALITFNFNEKFGKEGIPVLNLTIEHEREEETLENLRSDYKPCFRCTRCRKLLAKANSDGRIAGMIKCPRCGAINEI